MKSKQTTRTLCEGAIMVAMAVVLNFFKFDLFAQGGSMNLLFIPLMVFALRRGPVWGMGAGLVFGVLKAIIGGGIAYGWQSLLLDYALAYALTGLAGFTPKKPVLGTVIGALGALLSFVLSGVFVWGEYMPDVFLGMATCGSTRSSTISSTPPSTGSSRRSSSISFPKRRSSCSPKSKNVFTHPLFFPRAASPGEPEGRFFRL